MKEQLLEKLAQHVSFHEEDVMYYEGHIHYPETALFGFLVFKGELIEKDQDTGIYSSKVKVKGLFAKDSAYVVAALREETLYMVVYANDGPTNKDICQKVADRIIHM
ncbi:MAG: hypothetical protein HUJ80_02695 [Firmicutes bacterium]|nr:hypothetical protein [Bacillota bacterium]